jgi:hypothetical protein
VGSFPALRHDPKEKLLLENDYANDSSSSDVTLQANQKNAMATPYPYSFFRVLGCFRWIALFIE